VQKKMPKNQKHAKLSRNRLPARKAVSERFETRILMSATYTLTDLAAFDGSAGYQADAPLILDSHGNFYGTASRGGLGNLGSVFEMAAGSGTITQLASFNSGTGYDPTAPLVLDANGNLFGTTPRGGAHNQGTVFEVPAGSSTISALVSFNATMLYSSAGLVVDSQGDLFGTTYQGGTSNIRTVFEVVAGSGTITTLASLT
jgi:uncharacterized repeat protein (TIGR03803 family)